VRSNYYLSSYTPLVLAACWTGLEHSLGVRSIIERKCLGDCKTEVVEANMDGTISDEKWRMILVDGWSNTLWKNDMTAN
jgi:hypothetical protein